MASVSKDFKVRAGVVAGSTISGTNLVSTVSTGTAPLTVASTTLVSNLNAQYLNGNPSSAFGVLANPLSQFAATSSSQLAGVISDETGSGALVFGTSPEITTSITTGSSTFALVNTTATTVNFAGAATTLNIGAGSGTTTINNSLVVSGNLTVDGTVTSVNSTTISVDDKNLELGSTASPSDTTADGGGITLKGTTDKTFNWVDATDSWTSSEHLDLASGKVLKIGGTQVLSSSQYTGNAATATSAAAWTTARTVTLAGDLSGSVSIDGSANATLTATIEANSVALGTDTTGNYIATIAGTSNQVTVTGSGSESAAVTLALPQDIATSSTPTFAAVNHGTAAADTGDSVTISTNNAAATLDTFDVTVWGSAEYLVRMKQGDKVTTTHLTVMWDGSDCNYTEWGTMDASAGAANATLSASVSSNTCTVVATSGNDAATTNVVVKAKTTYVTA